MAPRRASKEHRVSLSTQSVQSTSSLNGFSDSKDSLSKVTLASPRKRRKLSISEYSDSDENVTIPAMAPTISRIKPHRIATPSTSQDLEETTVSNGKIVDAKSSFATLDVAPWLIASLSSMAIQRPTAIQKACIPEILAGKDVIGGSKTGSGKTMAFAVPILQKWAEDPSAIYAVILTPTR